MSTISRCLLSSTNYPCTLLQVKAPEGKPHALHVVQDVRNKPDGFLKFKKGVLCVPRVVFVPFFVAAGAAFCCVLRVLRVPGVLRVSYSCPHFCLWGCLYVFYMF